MFKKWWLPLLVVPFISFFVFVALYAVLYPLLANGVLPFVIQSFLAIKLIAIIGSILVPYVTTKIFKVQLLIPCVIWIVLNMIAMVVSPSSFEGNQNLGAAGHLVLYQIGAMILSSIFSSLELKKILGLKDENQS
ncbi:MAG: hypothetical protein ACOYL6_05605 [Bacteriovoracaceae bacterium]